MVGIRGQSPLNFFVLQILFCQENFLLRNIAKTDVLTPKNVLCPRKPLDLGYGSGLSKRSKGKQKQTVEQSQTNCQLKQIWRLHVKHDQMKLSVVFVY